jgi:hypothetical protein
MTISFNPSELGMVFLDAFKVLNESTQERITEYLDTQIAIEEDINYEGE